MYIITVFGLTKRIIDLLFGGYSFINSVLKNILCARVSAVNEYNPTGTLFVKPFRVHVTLELTTGHVYVYHGYSDFLSGVLVKWTVLISFGNIF